MERKTKKILRSLATRLVAEIGEVSSDQMKQAFKVAMDLLPDSLLKQDITTNDELYFDLLQSYVEDIERKAGNTQEKSTFPETSIRFPYNLYVRKGYRFVHKRLKTVPFRHRPAILSHLVSKQLTTLNSDNLLRLMQQDEEGSSDGTLTKSIKQFKILSCGNRNPVALIKVMNIYFQRKLTEMENYTQKKKMKSITKSKKDLKKFLLLCHFRHENFNKQSNDAMNHEYNNLIAAFLSLYLEMCFVSSHKLVAEDVGKELCGLVSFLLYSSPQHQLDVLLQLDISVVEINSVLLPLARKCLQVKPEKNNCEHYLRFVLAINYMHLCLGDTIDDLKQECRKIRAPDNFLEWLENKNPEIFEEIPSYQKFRGKVITRFLLDEMDSSLQISLLDIFTAVGKPSHKEVQEMTAAENKLVPSAMENENGDIFFIDTGNKKPGNEEDNTKDPKVSDLEPYDLKSDADVIFLGMRKEESEKVKDSTTEDESVEGMEDQGSLVNRENSFEVQSEHVKDIDSDDDCVIITNEVAEKSAAAAMEILEVEQSNYERMEIYKEMEVATNPWADCEEEAGQDEEGLNMMDRNGYSGSSKSTDEDNSDDDLESGTLYIDIPEDLDKNSTSQNSSQKETDQGFTHIKDRNEIEDAVVEQNSLVEKELLPKMQIPTNTSAVIDIELISDSEDSDTELQFSKGLLPSIKKHLKSPGSAFLHKKLDWNNSSDSCQNCRVKLQSLTKSIDVQEKVDVNEAGSSIASCMGNKERKFENSQDNSTPRQLTKIPPKMAGTEQSLVSDFQPKSSGNESLPEEAKTLQPKSSTTPALQTRLRSNHIQSVKPFKKSCVTLTQFKTRSTSKSRSESDIEPKMIMEQKNLKSSFNFPYSDDQNDLESRIPTLKKNSEQKKSVGSRNEKLDLVRKSEPHLRQRWQGMESSNVDHSNLVSEQAISTNSESDIHVHKEPVTLVDQVFGPKSTLKTYALRSKLSRDKSQSLKGSISSKMPISSSSDLSSRELSTMSSSVDSVGKGILCVFDEDDDSDMWFQTKSEGKNTSKELSVVKAFKDSDISGPDSSRSMRTRSMDFGLESSASKQGETRKSVEVSGDAYGNFAKSLVSKRKYAPPLTTDSPKRPKTRSMHPSGAGEIFVKKISPENSAPVQDLLLKALPRRSLRKQVTKESSSTDLNSNGLQQSLKPVLQSSYSQGSNSLETKRITRSHLSSNEESRVGLRSLRQRSLRAEKN